MPGAETTMGSSPREERVSIGDGRRSQLFLPQNGILCTPLTHKAPTERIREKMAAAPESTATRRAYKDERGVQECTITTRERLTNSSWWTSKIKVSRHDSRDQLAGLVASILADRRIRADRRRTLLFHPNVISPQN